MDATLLYLRALSAWDVVDRLRKLEDAFPTGEQLQFGADTNVGMNLAVANVAAGLLKDSEAVSTFLHRIKDKPYVLCKGAYLRNSANQYTVIYASTDGVIGSLQITAQNNADRAMSMLAAIEKHFTITTIPDLVGKVGPTAEGSALQLRERSVSDLRAELDKMSTFFSHADKTRN
jgi:hypothetical protein